jgi:dihydroflavonol-4-reductase
MILVTGGTGFIGSHLLDCLTARGERVRCLLRPTSVHRNPIPKDVETVTGNLENGEGLIPALRGAEFVIHLAGVTKALQTSQYYSGNVRATEMLLRAMEGSQARLIYVSSLAAAGPSPNGTPVAEDAVPCPLTHYGKSKLAAEELVRRLAPDSIIIRPPVVYGPRDTDVLQLLKSISRGWMVEIAGGERWFSAIYVKDLVEGLLLAARSCPSGGRTYYLTHPEPLSWTKFGETAAKIVQRRLRLIRVPRRGARVMGRLGDLWARARGRPGILSYEKVMEAECRFWLCDWRRARAELGFEAKTPLEAGLLETLAWYKEAGWIRY